ncbi:MAG: hypothetical protein ACRCXK_08560 [Wohlfahrtiimonas sp.]
MIKEVSLDNFLPSNHASMYARFGDKLVRFSDHLPKKRNIEDNNEGVNEFFFVFEKSENLNQDKVDRWAENFQDEMNCDTVEAYVIDLENEVNEDGLDQEHIAFLMKRFLN